ncbi:TonB-dependent receptor [Paraflavisolibacter sp. H34]|uniref:SusC/RagA family TonB-linked outer membrane protein n=1 Tax=Huijunlia imazamoxiresistens TaxID=3127457 RepID=UPI00301811BA
MNLIAAALLVCCLQVSAAGYPQGRVSLKVRNEEIGQAIAKIEKQTAYRFLYNSDLEGIRHRVTLEARDAVLTEVLEKMLAPAGLAFELMNDRLIAIKKDTRETPVLTISGRVTNDKMEPLPGVSVAVKDEEAGTKTDEEGRYSIAVKSKKPVLVFSFVGYTVREVEVGSQKTIDISLVPLNQSLDNVVVIGYGTVKKRDLTGSVVSLKSEQITSTPVTNVLETMQGKVAGLDLTRSSGETGAPMNFTIRGNRSLNASNAPLILVDGIQYGAYIDINPNDVASIEVLKDASSTAIYGSRGANGVIIITTKSGKGKTKVELNNYYGINALSDYDRQTNLEEYMAMTRESYRALGKWSSPADDASIFGGGYENIQKGINTNWIDLMVHRGAVQSHHAALSGGNDKTTFRLSSEYFHERGFLKNDNLKRFVQHLNLDHKLAANLKIGTVLNFNSSTQERRNTSFWNLMKGVPYGVPYNEDGTLKQYPWPGKLDINPLMDESTDNYANNTASSRIFMVGFGEWGITKNLLFKTNVGVDINNSQQGIFEGKNTTVSGTNNGFSRSLLSDNKSRSLTWENVLNYTKAFKNHDINLMGGTSLIKNRSVLFSGEGKNQPFSTALFYNLGANTNDIRVSSSLSESQLASGFGRLNYKFKDRYLLTASLRADGASVLAEGAKWAYFPSVAVAWRLVDEPFLSKVPLLSELKLRTSYGVSGNSAIQPYQTQGGLSRVPFAFDETPAIGYWPNIIANKDLGWEKTATINAGLDFGLFTNKIMGTIDVYHTRTSDLLMQRILPSVTGFNSIIDNVGKTKTSGIDFTLSSRNLSTPRFTWTTDFNYSRFNEEIVALSVGGDDVSKGWFVGKPLRVFYDYEKTGIWQSGDKDLAATYGHTPGEIRVKDLNNDGKITAKDDRAVLGQASPKWTAGMSNNFSYKNISLNVLIYARVGQMISSDYAGSYYPGGLFNTAVVDYWTPENPTNAYPRPKANVTDQYLATLKYLDGSFWKIKDIRLAYNLTKSSFKKLPFSNVVVYATAKNQFTFSKVKNYDPERGGSVDYPLTKQLVFGLNLAL